jgi:hypothetical protein
MPDFQIEVFLRKTSPKALDTTASRGEPSPRCGSVEYTMPSNILLGEEFMGNEQLEAVKKQLTAMRNAKQSTSMSIV